VLLPGMTVSPDHNTCTFTIPDPSTVSQTGQNGIIQKYGSTKRILAIGNICNILYNNYRSHRFYVPPPPMPSNIDIYMSLHPSYQSFIVYNEYMASQGGYVPEVEYINLPPGETAASLRSQETWVPVPGLSGSGSSVRYKPPNPSSAGQTVTLTCNTKYGQISKTYTIEKIIRLEELGSSSLTIDQGAKTVALTSSHNPNWAFSWFGMRYVGLNRNWDSDGNCTLYGPSYGTSTVYSACTDSRMNDINTLALGRLVNSNSPSDQFGHLCSIMNFTFTNSSQNTVQKYAVAWYKSTYKKGPATEVRTVTLQSNPSVTYTCTLTITA
jgi:hypothetical protein